MISAWSVSVWGVLEGLSLMMPQQLPRPDPDIIKQTAAPGYRGPQSNCHCR